MSLISRNLFISGILICFSIILSSCASTGETYTRAFPEEPEILWTNLVSRIENSGDKILTKDPASHKIKIRRILSLYEIHQYAEDAPSGIVGTGEADIDLWITETNEGKAELNSQATIVASQYRRTMQAGVGLFGDTQGFDSWPQYEEDINPIVLKSDGTLELEYLGYSMEQAKQLKKISEIQDEFLKIREEYPQKP